MSTLLQLWREVCERSPALVNPDGKHLIVSASDCLLLGCEIERACLPPAPESIVETLASGWQPIETAPKDGTEVLAWRDDCGHFIASYTSMDAFPLTQDEIDAAGEETLFAKDWFSQWPQAFRLEGSETPTHWMPLPAAPIDEVKHAEASQN